MSRSRLDEVVDLAMQRWAQNHKFDLDRATWARLFTENQPGVVLEAIKLAKVTRDPDPQKAYEFFLKCLERVAARHPNYAPTTQIL